MVTPRLLVSSGPSRVARPARPVDPLPMAIQSVTSAGVRSERVRTTRGRASGRRLAVPLAGPDHAGCISGGQGDSAGQHGSVRDTALAPAEQQAGASARRTATPGSPPRYTRGPREVHARYTGLPAPRHRTDRPRAVLRAVKGHRDFPVGGQLISLRADRLCPFWRPADLLRSGQRCHSLPCDGLGEPEAGRLRSGRGGRGAAAESAQVRRFPAAGRAEPERRCGLGAQCGAGSRVVTSSGVRDGPPGRSAWRVWL